MPRRCATLARRCRPTPTQNVSTWGTMIIPRAALISRTARSSDRNFENERVGTGSSKQYTRRCLKPQIVSSRPQSGRTRLVGCRFTQLSACS